MSWSGRLASFKMLCLPQIHTLPISLKNIHLKALQDILKQLLWQSKHHCFSKALLIKHRLAGGMANIDFHDYFHASLLTQLRQWILPTPYTLWCQIESTLSPCQELCSFCWKDAWKPFLLHQLSSTMQASLQAWRELRKIHPTLTTANHYTFTHNDFRKFNPKYISYLLAD